MHILEIHNLEEARAELNKIKPDRAGIAIMAPKAVFRTIKIKDIPPTVSNIIKQEMLALGAEAANMRGAINHSVKKSDLLLMGTLQQYMGLIKILKKHSFGLPQLAQDLKKTLKEYDKKSIFHIAGKNWKLGMKTYVMGILNTTPDSFSDGGKYFSAKNAINHGLKMIDEGADIIDIGGESTRPGSEAVPAKEQIKRVIPVIKKLSKSIPVSIDTYKSEVAKAALNEGACMVNDISGLHFDKKMGSVVAAFKAGITIMHIQGTPKNMQIKPHYDDLIAEIINYLNKGLAIAENTGILNDRIMLDPGFGFGKTISHNLEILKRLREIKSLGYPILIGTSRKSAIGQVLNLPVEERLEGTAATVAIAIQNGADIIRVHDVLQMKRVAEMTDAITRRP